jgi:hypothetical protein
MAGARLEIGEVIITVKQNNKPHGQSHHEIGGIFHLFWSVFYHPQLDAIALRQQSYPALCKVISPVLTVKASIAVGDVPCTSEP